MDKDMGLRVREAGLDRSGLGLLLGLQSPVAVETFKEAEPSALSLSLFLSWVGERTSSALELLTEGGAFSLLLLLLLRLPVIVIIIMLFLKAFSLVLHRLLEGFTSLIGEALLPSGTGLGATISGLSTAALMLK